VSPLHIAGSLLLSLLVLGVIGYLTFDPETFGATLRQVQPAFLVLALGMALARVGFGGWRLRHVSQGRLGWASGLRAQLAWYFFANVTPTVVGGGPVTAFYVAYEEDLSVGKSAAIMLFCMVMNQLWFVIAVGLLVGVGLPLGVLPEAAGTWGTRTLLACFAGLFVWGLAFAYFTLVRPRRLVELAGSLLQWPLLQRFRERGMRELRSYFRRAKRLGRQSPSFYGGGLALTGLLWTARYAVIFFVVQSLWSTEGVLLFLRAAATVMVGLLLPTPGGSGGLEGLYALLIGPLMPEALMAPTLLLWRMLDYYLFIALGAYLFVHHIGFSSSSD
jgi:hypothetical protein